MTHINIVIYRLEQEYQIVKQERNSIDILVKDKELTIKQLEGLLDN